MKRIIQSMVALAVLSMVACTPEPPSTPPQSGGGGVTPPQSAAAITDENGQVIFNIAGQDVPFKVIDEITGSPVPGLSIGMGMDPAQPSHAILVIADFLKQYPLQIVVLQGPSPVQEPGVSVSISPTTASVSTGGTQQFTATVTGSTNTSVTWSVQEGSPAGGTVIGGLYTAPNTPGTYHVIVTSQADNTRSATASVTVTTSTPPKDTTPPTTPTGLVATPISPNQINLSWNASTDDVGVVGYWIWRYINGEFFDPFHVPGTSLEDNELTPNTWYCYYVAAYDAADVYSNPYAGPVCAMTPNPSVATPLVKGSSRTAPAKFSSVKAAPSATTLSVPVRSGTDVVLSGVITTLETGLLPQLIPSSSTKDYSSPFLAALHAFSTSNVFLPPPWTGVLPSVVEKKDVPAGEVNDYILEKQKEALVSGIPMFLLYSSLGELELPITELSNSMSVGALANFYVDYLGATSIIFTKIRFGGTIVEMPLPVFKGLPRDIFPTNPNLHVSATTSTGQPLSGGSLAILCPKIDGLAYSAVLDTQGQANIPALPCDYTGEVKAKGYSPTPVNITVPPSGGTNLNISVQPQPIDKLTVTSNPLSPGGTGFLPAGTQVQFNAIATDVNKNVVPCVNTRYYVNNPVGSTVATIDPITGLLTVGPDDGAAKVFARGCGFTSNPILVSGTGNGDACTYTYTDWSACQPDSTQSRTVTSSSPPGCVGTPITTESCTYIPPPSGEVTGIAFSGGVGGFGSFINVKITPDGLFGVSITCDWVGNLGSKATRTTTTLHSDATCSYADVASWPDSTGTITATVTGTSLNVSTTY